MKIHQSNKAVDVKGFVISSIMNVTMTNVNVFLLGDKKGMYRINGVVD